MFKKVGIKLSQNDLRNFFHQVDGDQNDDIDWTEFKNALTDQDTAQTYIDIMRKIKLTQKVLPDYTPQTFPQMIQYINYCDIRQDLIESIQRGNEENLKKFQKCKELISLGEKCYSNNDINKRFGQKLSDNLPDQDNSLSIGLVKHINWKKRNQEMQHKQIRQDRLKILNRSYDQNNTSNLQGVKSISLDHLHAKQNKTFTHQAQDYIASILGGQKIKNNNAIYQQQDLIKSENQILKLSKTNKSMNTVIVSYVGKTLPYIELLQNVNSLSSNYRTQDNKTQPQSYLTQQNSEDLLQNQDNSFSPQEVRNEMPQIGARMLQTNTQIVKLPQIIQPDRQSALQNRQYTYSTNIQTQSKHHSQMRKILKTQNKKIDNKFKIHELSFEDINKTLDHGYQVPFLKLMRQGVSTKLVNSSNLSDLVQNKNFQSQIKWIKIRSSEGGLI